MACAIMRPMGIYDQIQINDPRFPRGCGEWFQAYVEIEDSYGDFYELTADGCLYRLTDNACMSRSPKYALAAPVFLDDYNDSALTVLADYLDDQGRTNIYGYVLTFERGILTAWTYDPELIPPPPTTPPSSSHFATRSE